MSEPLAALDALEAAGLAAFREAGARPRSRPLAIEFLGQKQGKIKAAQERLKSIPNEAKRAYGQRFNAVKTALEAACESARSPRRSPQRPSPAASTSPAPAAPSRSSAIATR